MAPVGNQCNALRSGTRFEQVLHTHKHTHRQVGGAPPGGETAVWRSGWRFQQSALSRRGGGEGGAYVLLLLIRANGCAGNERER